MKKLLTLLRHAKSSWANAQTADHDRPLNDRGLRDTKLMAGRLLEHGAAPELVYCSTAERARQTIHRFADACGLTSEQIVFIDELYLATPEQLTNIIGGAPAEVNHLMVVGHNPGMEQLLGRLGGQRDITMPTCALAKLTLTGHSFSLDTDSAAELVWFDYPKSVPKSEPKGGTSVRVDPGQNH